MNQAIGAEEFVRFAGSDVDRWRELTGGAVEHRDSRFGRGIVRDVRWEHRRDGVRREGTIYVIVVYENGLTTETNARAFAELHSTVEVLSPLAGLIDTCFGSAASLSEPEREELVARYDRELRQRRDAERLRRTEELRRRARKTPDEGRS